MLSAYATNAAIGQAAAAALVNVVVNTTKDQIDPAGSKTVSLRDAIAHTGGPVSIAFDPTVFAKSQVIDLTMDNLELSNKSGPITITGPAAGVTLASEFSGDILIVDAGVTATISGLTIEGTTLNSFGDFGAGVVNNGNLTIGRSQILPQIPGHSKQRPTRSQGQHHIGKHIGGRKRRGSRQQRNR